MNTSKLFISTLFIGALSACASAPKPLPNLEQINRPFTDIEVGYSYLQQISGPGATRQITWVYQGQEDNLYRWNLYRDSDITATPWRVQWYNNEGSSVKQQYAKNTAKWKPHNCFRVIGECSFVYEDNYGIENSYIRESQFDGKVWSYQLFSLRGESRSLISNGHAEFNLQGIEIFHEYFTNNNGHQLSQVTQIYGTAEKRQKDNL